MGCIHIPYGIWVLNGLHVGMLSHRNREFVNRRFQIRGSHDLQATQDRNQSTVSSAYGKEAEKDQGLLVED